MKAVYFERCGGPEVLLFGERPEPMAGPGEVLVRVRACAVNHLDLWVRQGLPGLEPEMPHILGNDIVGEIAALGAGVTRLSVGQKTLVNPTLSCGTCTACARGDDHLCRSYDVIGRRRNGGYAEYVSVPAANCLPYPERLPWEQAAAVPLVFLTAWHMLVTRAHVKAGDDVLVIGAGSGVGSAAIQIARLHGARVIATASTPAKLAKDGRLVTCGATTGSKVTLEINALFGKHLSLLGSWMGRRSDLEDALVHVASGALQPVVDSVLPLADARHAHERIEAREQFGKLVLVP